MALAEKKYEIRQLVTRDYRKAVNIANLIHPVPEILGSDELQKISSDIVFITTQDTLVNTVADELAEKMEHLPYIYHTSGSLSSSALQKLRDGGCEVGSIHPLVSVSDPQTGAAHFKGAYFCLEGDERAVQLGRQIVEDLEGRSFSVPGIYKPLYHASAVTAAGHIVALVSVALEMLTKCGLSEEKAKEVLLPLIYSSVDNLVGQTPAQALTGTFARADSQTLKTHIEALKENVSPEALRIYLEMGLRSLVLAKESGADEAKLAEMSEIISAVESEIEVTA